METQANESNYPNRRRPWTAVFLSLVMPGLGQLYCGNIGRGMVIISVITLFSFAWIAGIFHNKCPDLSYALVHGGAILLVVLIVAIDAWRRACRTRYDYQLKDYNRWWVYLALIWISSAGVVGYAALFKNSMAEAFIIGANSMWPSIVKGDRLIADKMAYDNAEPQRGDIILFSNPQKRKQKNVKRIIALGGDTVEGKNGQLWINGQPLQREWIKAEQAREIFYETNNGVRYQITIAKSSEASQENAVDFGPVTVPPYHCFVMGDNRSDSYDSRQYGTISLGAIRGKFRYLYWPKQDWSRFGAVE